MLPVSLPGTPDGQLKAQPPERYAVKYSPMADKMFCESSSRSAGEQLFGTAPRVDYWLALEVPQVYGHQAFQESRLPPAVKAHLAQSLGSRPNIRLQLIKRARNAQQAIRFFVAVNHEEEPNLYEFRLQNYQELLSLDIAAILDQEHLYTTHERKTPLFLVCTNGRRDACCSRLGLPVFQAVRSTAGDSVWQTSHVGGHRFAGNLLVLPHGIYYGRLDAAGASAVVNAHRSGQIHLPNYRGRSCYDTHVQAAESFLRRDAGGQDLLRFKLVEIETIASDEWIFHFQDRTSQHTHCVQIRREISSLQVLKSCREEAAVPVAQFKLIDLQTYADLGRLS